MARVGTGSQLSELEQLWPERVLVHSFLDGGNGGQKWYWFTADGLEQWRPKRVLVRS